MPDDLSVGAIETPEVSDEIKEVSDVDVVDTPEKVPEDSSDDSPVDVNENGEDLVA